MIKNRVLILLSTYNGEKYLQEQLESILNQKNVLVDILVRDDESKDDTLEILKEYKNKYKNIDYYCGENLGYAKSFWNLIENCKNEYDYYAFCDQDDIWLENKLSAAIDRINNIKEDIPILYTGRVISINNHHEIIDKDTFKVNKVLNVYESFQRSVVPGCVFVFNKKALLLLKKFNGFMESHDWATYCIINTFGKVIYDNNSYIHYRIHDNNAIGKNTRFDVLRKRIKRFFKKSKCVRSKFAYDFLKCYGENIPNEYYFAISLLGTYQNNFNKKIKLIFCNDYKGIIFKLYVLLNRM